ncbi:GNAT family N-acetyltransferase [Pseudohongiella nitratireducens]|uniref:GNAT family N-acetyltransferase n=1 Tax=Pseudohongiella nitratireducens TaxID=1768907 RepID=UPI0030EDEE93|tara:strand:- start:6031 stop:6522 length:492 start_codon:yes stop_codon:yes gene_type:complete
MLKPDGADISLTRPGLKQFNTNLSARPALPDEMPWAFQLFKRCLGRYIDQTWGWDEVFQQHGFLENFSPSNFDILILKDVRIGGISLISMKRHLQLELLVIDAPWRNSGLGSTIMQSLIMQATAESLPIRLKVLRCNPAYNFYQRLNFRTESSDNERYQMIYP